MAGQHEILSCPFCDKPTIACLYFPSVWGERTRRTATFGSTKKITKSADTWLIQSGCSNCDKPQEDVEKELRKQGII